MTPTIEMPAAPSNLLDYEVHFPEDLPCEDNENMDTPWHRAQMELLINIIETNWKGRRFYCGGNMFIHFSAKHIRNKDFRGPDFFVVLDVDHDKPRLYWAVWEEDGRYPDVIVELISPTTEDEDRTTKKAIYERTFKTHEYFLFDFQTQALEGWRLSKKFRPIPIENGRMWSEELEMTLGTWRGVWDGHEASWLRFFDRDGNMLPTGEEKQARRAQAEADRANAAEGENDLLRRELETLRQQLNSKTP